MAEITTATTNFNQTVTALVLKQIAENLRKRPTWLEEGSWIRANLIPGTNLLRYIGYGDLSTATQALVEGTAPTPEALTIAYEEFNCAQRGRTIRLTDVAMGESPHNLFAVASERISYNAFMTLDTNVGETIRDYVTAPAVVLANSHARAAVVQASSDFLTSALIRTAVTQLRKDNVETFADGSYHCKIHPFVARDLQEETGTTGQFLDVNKYIDNTNILAGEIGKLYGVRFMETNTATYVGAVGGSGAHVFRTTIYGPGYYAVGDEMSIQSYMVAPGGDHLDPLAQAALVGWKAMWGTKVLALTGAGPKFRGIDTASSAAAAG